jgi:GH15 family glucan-1,4-alpha-glucosidase
MPRDIPVGNGRLLICFDQNYCLRDLYYPHVGQENHIGGHFCRLGIWVENQFSWVGPGWKRDLRYLPDTLVTQVSLYHKDFGLLLNCQDAVDFHENICLREVSVENMIPRPREIRLFFSHDFNISGNDVGDTAAFDPLSGAVVHYKGARYFLINGFTVPGKGLSQFAVGQKGIGGREGTFRDAEDGLLSGNPIAQGSVDSVVGLTLQLDGMARGKANYWIAAGQNWKEVRRLDDLVKGRGAEHLIRRTQDYWLLWVRKETPPLEHLPEPVGQLYRRSLLILSTQIDWQGGIIAANDSDIINFARDTYCYVWPRDAALAANALDLAGYSILARNFYQFAADTLEKEGYFLHKYNPDGTLASSWHPWFHEGVTQLPIQEDETALVIWALWNHFVLYRDIEFIKPLYRPLIKAAADFICRYRDAETGLPDESYDLWEERRGILSFTVGAVFGGLTAASLFCTVFGEEEIADRYRKVAGEIRDAASTYLWREDLNRFCRMVYRNKHGAVEVDASCDASLWGLFAFGLYSVDHPKIISTFATLREKLWVKTQVGGMARYENDSYQRVSPEVTGNPWFICSLWLADYLTERAQNEKDLAPTLAIMKWVCDHSLPSGVLAEQINPLTGEALSVSPLTWSHATFVASTQRILRRIGKMKVCPECGSSLIGRSRTEDWVERMFTQACDSIHGSCRVA